MVLLRQKIIDDPNCIYQNEIEEDSEQFEHLETNQNNEIKENEENNQNEMERMNEKMNCEDFEPIPLSLLSSLSLHRLFFLSSIHYFIIQSSHNYQQVLI